MRSGGLIAHKLRHVGRIQRRTPGDAGDTYTTGDMVAMDVQPIRGMERFRAGEVESELTHLVTMRYPTTASASDRVLFGERTLELVSVINVDERNQVIEMTAKELGGTE